ncbi:MAG: DUF2207 domain-containing protein, partial [Firmicutes bacterium]|nr:DUF2207 domain-containing protein [Bacillota bacterium]
MRRFIPILGLMLLAAWAVAAPVSAGDGERILSFDSFIRVHRDGGMTVEEIIKVRALGREIKRGIYRDFPTDYRDRLGNRVVVRFEVLTALRDGLPEAYR